MGCGASVQEPEPPQEPEDPMAALMRQINEARSELTPKLPDLQKEETEQRFLRTQLFKLDRVIEDMQEDAQEEQKAWDAIKVHIAKRDAIDVNEASVGFGTDEAKMAAVVVARLEEDLTISDDFYKNMYGRTLEDQIRGENKSILGLLTGSLTDFGRFLTYRCQTPAKRDSFLVHKCMAGMGCSDYILVEILSTRTNAQLQAAAEAYAEDQDGEDMVERIKKETGGFGKKWYGLWIDTLVEFDRDESTEVQGDPVELAQQLYDAGAGKWMGCDEQPFIDILCKANEPTCQAIAAAYEELDCTSNTLAEDVESKMGGDLEFAVLARVNTQAGFLSKRLYKACKGWGTDEECICRVLSCLTKQEAKDLHDAYNEIYAEEEEPYNDLNALLASELSGNFLQALLDFIATVPPKGHDRPAGGYMQRAEQAGEAFREEVEEAYDDASGAALGAGPLDCALQLCNVDGPFLKEAGGFDVAIISPYPAVVEADRSALFSPDPEDIEAAQALLGKLQQENGVVDGRLAELRNANTSSTTDYAAKAGEMRRVEHYLNQIADDNDAMTEYSAQRDADAVREAVEGWGTDEGKLIMVLCALTKRQLRRVDAIYQERYGSTLRQVTDDELGGFFEGTFKYFMKCLITPPHELDAELLLESMKGWGTNDTLLCELVCTRTNKELGKAIAAFQETEGKSVAEWVDGDTGGAYQNFLLRCLQADRQEGTAADEGLASEQARALQGKGLGGGDVDDGYLTELFATASVAQCQAIRRAYEAEFGRPLTEAIKEALGGDWERALLTRVLDPPTYFATKLEEAAKGWGTDEKCISRILGRARKPQIAQIEARYEELHGRTLREMVTAETSGHFKEALLQTVYGEVAAAAPPV